MVGLKLNGMYPLVAYADVVYLLEDSVGILNKMQEL
jgi:hypothetical protein